MRFVRENGLSLFFFALFAGSLAGQAIAGHADHNEGEIAHARLLDEEPGTLSFWRYVFSSSFGQAVMENWQSEYLQFTLFVVATIWLVQKGSTESKPPGNEGTETKKEQKIGEHAPPDAPRWAKLDDWRTRIYSNSLLIVMLLIFLGSWFADSTTGWSDYSAEQIQHEQPEVSYWSSLGSARFWESTLQNWQSEFLAVGSMAILTVYLRQRGSQQSKPVGSPHHETGSEG